VSSHNLEKWWADLQAQVKEKMMPKPPTKTYFILSMDNSDLDAIREYLSEENDNEWHTNSDVMQAFVESRDKGFICDVQDHLSLHGEIDLQTGEINEFKPINPRT